MKNPILLRLFILFPFIGIAMPDAAFLLKDAAYKVPMLHIIILAILVVLFSGSFAFKHNQQEQQNKLT